MPSRTTRTRTRLSSSQAVWAPKDDPSPAVEMSTSTGIDVETVTYDAKVAIESRQSVIQSLRSTADQLRTALAQVESLHEALISGYNPPGIASKAPISGSVARLNR